MNKKINLFWQGHYVAPAFEVLSLEAASIELCVGSPAFGDPNHAGAEIDVEETYEF